MPRGRVPATKAKAEKAQPSKGKSTSKGKTAVPKKAAVKGKSKSP
jgi:hypothetical protein